MILGILQARTSSTRLPKKILKPLMDEPMLSRQIERIKRSKKIFRLVVATSKDPSDDSIQSLCQRMDVGCFRGQLSDVLERFYQAAHPLRPDHIVRLTGDCPLADPRVIDAVIQHHLSGKFDYTSNVHPPTFPDGLDVEIFITSCLVEAWQEATLPSERESVTSFIWKRPDRFRLGNFKSNKDYSKLRWTVDEIEDYEFIKQIYESLYPVNSNFSMEDVLKLLEKNPELSKINSRYERNEGFKKMQADDRTFLEARKEKVKHG